MSDKAARSTEPRAGPVPAIEHFDEIARLVSAGTPALFLDYDGTLAPIVEHADDAHLAPGIRDVLARLVAAWPVAIVSGRRVSDVRERVGVDGVVVLGDHGLVCATAQEERVTSMVRPDHGHALDRVAKTLEPSLEEVEGAWLERKQCTLTVHTRQVEAQYKPRVEDIVDRSVDPEDRLIKVHGKEVLEVRPRLDWDKGAAVMDLLGRLERERPGLVPIMIGDDVSDESVFEALQGRGVTVRVGQAKQTAAQYTLSDPGQVREFLERLEDRFL